MEEELPFDLNPGVPTKLPMVDSHFHTQLTSSDAPNSTPHPLTPSLPGAFNNEFLAKSQVPPRPKPPVPYEYFVYPKRSWRSMTKEQVRMHIWDRYNARERYNAAYSRWEEKHSKWVFGIYHLVRAVTKPQRQEMQPEVEDAQEKSSSDGPEDGERTTTATDVIGDLDVNFETALTALQEGAEADELDRVKRWWIQTTQQNRQNRPDKKKVCNSTPVLPILDRQGSGMFGSRGSGSLERHGTPDIELPHQVAQKIHSSMSSCVPPNLLSSQEDSSMSESEEDADEDEDEEGKGEPCPSWRIYSDQCACGYAGCHCRSWMRWWNKTFQMLKYVEYVELPLSMSVVPGEPAPEDELLGGPATRYTRVSVGERYELVKRDPPVRSLHNPKNPKSKKRPWSLKNIMALRTYPNLLYFTRVPDKQRRNQDGSAGALDVQSSPRHIFKTYWEDYSVLNPKIPAEYYIASARNMNSKLTPLCLPRSVVAIPQWPSRSRALQWISYVQYSYRLPSEIFFLAINLLDRFAAGCQQIANLNGAHWDVLGIACLWLAWKYESYNSLPRTEEIIAHSEFRLTRSQLISAEWTVRNTIGLDLSYSSPITFARLKLVSCNRKRETAYVARFLAEILTTVRQLVCCQPANVGLVTAWLACILTDVQFPLTSQAYIGHDKATGHQIAMHILMGVLNMPRPIEKPREQALFYKWTLPIVNNIAGWCQQTLDSVWPDRVGDGALPCFDERLPDLRATVRSRPFKLGPGPSPEHALFED